MRLSISPALLADLLGGPFLVLDRPPPDRPNGIRLFWLDDTGRLLVAANEVTPSVPLDGLPVGCLALVASNKEGLARLERLRAFWNENAPQSTPPIVDLSALGVGIETLVDVAAPWDERLRQAMVQAGELTAQVVALRSDVEQLTTRNSELAREQPRAALDAAFKAPPGQEATPAGAAVRQRLPISARGLSALDLYVATPCEREEQIKVELWRLEEDVLLARFALLAKGGRGWRRFVLGEAADCAEGTVELRVYPSQGMRLSLAAARPGQAERAEILEHGAPLAAPLALHLFRDRPGTLPALNEDAAWKARVMALEASTSWRLTAPLRQMADYAKRIVRMFAGR